MTLLEFIKSHLGEDSAFGDLAEDVIGDKNFPYDKGDERIESYLEFTLRKQRNLELFENLMKAYQSQKEVPVEFNDLDTKFVALRAERWEFLKANFPCNSVIIVGEPGDIYRVYAVDSVGEEAIKFDVYGKRGLTDLSVVEVENIPFGSLTTELSVIEALQALAENKFEGTRSPTQPNYSEMIDYLKSSVKSSS